MPITRSAVVGRTYLLGPGEAALACDFGSTSSKQALAYLDPHTDRVNAVRVRVDLDYDDPDRTEALFELAGVAALSDNGDGSFVIRRQSLSMDYNIPLKTLLTYASGITSIEIVKQLPGGKNLVQVLANNAQITSDKIDTILRQHFAILHKSAIAKAQSCKVTIKVVVLTYPNYLCPREGYRYFDKYIEKYIALVRSIWGDTVRYETASEGQAAAAYICAQFDDPITTSHDQRNAKLFQGLRQGTELNLLVVDGGASTLNYQSLSVYFSEDGKLLNSMSNVPHGMVTGTQGGSDVANHIARDIIEQKHLKHLSEHTVLKGDLADIMTDFDDKKKRFDYTDNQASLTLRGGSPVFEITLTPEQSRKPFETAFLHGIQLLKQQLQRMLNLGRDFAVLFCGGSYCNPGLYNVVGKMMRDAEAVGNKTGINI